MATLNDAYKDIERAKELSIRLFTDFAYDGGNELLDGADIADEAARLLSQVASDFAALGEALAGTREE